MTPELAGKVVTLIVTWHMKLYPNISGKIRFFLSFINQYKFIEVSRDRKSLPDELERVLVFSGFLPFLVHLVHHGP